MLPAKTISDGKNRKHPTLKAKTVKPMAMAPTAPPRKKARMTSGTDVEVIHVARSPHPLILLILPRLKFQSAWTSELNRKPFQIKLSTWLRIVTSTLVRPPHESW